MKKNFLLPAVIMFSGLLAHAGETLQDIIKEREGILEQLVEIRKRQVEGTASAEGEAALFEAKLALYGFRVDAATNSEERRKWQGMIVDLEAENVAAIEGKVKSGVAQQADLLEARSQYLAALQKQAELEEGK